MAAYGMPRTALLSAKARPGRPQVPHPAVLRLQERVVVPLPRRIVTFRMHVHSKPLNRVFRLECILCVWLNSLAE